VADGKRAALGIAKWLDGSRGGATKANAGILRFAQDDNGIAEVAVG